MICTRCLDFGNSLCRAITIRDGNALCADHLTLAQVDGPNTPEAITFTTALYEEIFLTFNNSPSLTTLWSEGIKHMIERIPRLHALSIAAENANAELLKERG